MEIGIYKIRNTINGKIYVGSSKELLSRWRHHVNSLKRGDHHSRHLQRAWDKYGEHSFKFEIIEYTEESMLVEREQYYLDTLNPCDRHIGYNVAPTAESPLGITRTEETKRKLREINLGKKLSEDTKKKIGAGLKNSQKWLDSKQSPEYREKLRQANLGENNPNWGNAHGKSGEDHYMFGRFGKLHHRAQRIGQYTKSGVLIKEWDSFADITRDIGLKHPNIVSCCKGRLQSAYGYVWKYLD